MTNLLNIRSNLPEMIQVSIYFRENHHPIRDRRHLIQH